MPNNSSIQYWTYCFHFLPSFLLSMYSMLILHVSKSSPNRMNCEWIEHVWIHMWGRLYFPKVITIIFLIPHGLLDPSPPPSRGGVYVPLLEPVWASTHESSIKDAMWLLRSGHKNAMNFHFVLLGCLLFLTIMFSGSPSSLWRGLQPSMWVHHLESRTPSHWQATLVDTMWNRDHLSLPSPAQVADFWAKQVIIVVMNHCVLGWFVLQQQTHSSNTVILTNSYQWEDTRPQ